MNRGVRSSTGNSSGPSVGASSMVTDGNSALSGGPHLQRSASINTDSYLRLPASPMSFSSNNISGSSVMDGGSIMQQSSYQEQMQKQGASSVTSQPASQDPGFLVQPIKKPRLDIRQDDILQPQVIQQLLQRQDTSQSQRPNPQMQAFMQQKLLQQQMLQSLPPMQRAHIQQQQQLRQQMQQQVLQQGPYTKRPFDSGICARRLMQYMYHQRHRPHDNNIHYWRKFVAEYFSPRAKKKWCMSSYDNVGNHALGVFPQAATDAWHCDICGSKTGKGFEATFEVLPRLNRIKFDSGITDELLFLEMPHECRLASGIMLLEYAKVTQASIYDQLRVVREGQLRIIFTPDLKILSWEFCARRHEEFLPRRLVAPQVNQLLQVAQKYQNAITENASSGVAPQDLQTNCNMFVTAGRQLARNLELQSLNDLGFSKRFIRCLQISEVVNSMKDLIDFSGEHKNGPIECLKIFPRHAAVKLQNQKMQEPDPIMNSQNFPNDQSTVNKLSTIHPGPVSAVNKIQSVPGMLNTSPQSSTIALNNYQILMRQNSTNSNLSAVQMDHVNGVSQAQLQGSVPPSPGSLTNTSANALLATQHPSLCANLPQQNSSPASQVNHHLQQHVIQQLLQERMNNNRGIPQQFLCGPNLKGSAGKEVFGSGNCNAGEMPILRSTGSMGNGVQFVNGPSMTNDAVSLNSNGSNNFKSVPNPNNPTILGNNSFQLKQEMPASFQVKEEMPSSFQVKEEMPSSFEVKQEMSQSLQLPDLVQDMADFTDSGIFNDVPETWAMG